MQKEASDGKIKRISIWDILFKFKVFDGELDGRSRTSNYKHSLRFSDNENFETTIKVKDFSLRCSSTSVLLSNEFLMEGVKYVVTEFFFTNLVEKQVQMQVLEVLENRDPVGMVEIFFNRVVFCNFNSFDWVVDGWNQASFDGQKLAPLTRPEKPYFEKLTLSALQCKERTRAFSVHKVITSKWLSNETLMRQILSSRTNMSWNVDTN